MGQEKTGITEEALAPADQDIIIPMIGMVQVAECFRCLSPSFFTKPSVSGKNAGMYLRENSMLPEAEQQRLLFEGGYPVLAKVANAKALSTPTSISKARSKLMPTGGLPCRLQGKGAMKGRLLDAVPLSSLTGVGAALSNKLAKINLQTVQDLLTPSPALRRSHPSLPHRRTTTGRLCHGGRRSAELQYLPSAVGG